ncbi:hypothetical protein [Longitalea arenae]|uniref:hypothetical protein n=1 Tax=Longitalea arenae TaxID=2812558 RepID=UPI0019671762|nr:hypothetical protein [Longitalea arenae]
MERKAEIWLNFIRNEISPAHLFVQMAESVDFSFYLKKSAQAREDFINGLIAEAISLRKESEMEVIMTGYQSLLTFLINQVYGYLSQCENRPEFEKLYKIVITDLEATLEFVHVYFHKYIDQAAFAPESHINILRQDLQLLEPQIKKTLAELGENAKEGQQVLAEIKNICAGQLSFKHYSYLNDFLKGTVDAITDNIPVRFHSRLIDYCIVKNFNSSSFLKYCFASYSEKLSSLQTGQEKRDWLKQFQKYLFQLPIQQQVGLYAHQPAVREYLLTWAEQELLYGETDQKKESATAADTVPKINTSVSVPVLALLTRVFKESGIITNTNLQELFRSVSAHYTSQRSESISPANFHGKYYTVEESTKRKVTDLLMEMVKVVRKIP